MGEAAELGKLDVAQAAEVGTACHKLLEVALTMGWAPHLLADTVGSVVDVVSRNDGSEHAMLSPSSAERWSTCPGSVVLVRKLAESAPTHARVVVTEEMVEWVEVALRWVLEYVRENPGSLVMCEERARAGVPFGCPDEMWGTTDVVIVNRQKLELVVADAKFGYVEVQAAGNRQLLLYAVGLAHDFGWAFRDYRAVILQPRSEVPVKQEVLPQARLQEEMQRLAPKVARALLQFDLLAEGKPLELVPTDEGCKWCEAAPVCPELARRPLQLARREFAEPELLPRSSLVEVLQKADLVRAYLNAAEAHAARLLALGQEVPGFKLVRSRKHRIWRDEQAAARVLQKLTSLDSGQLYKLEFQFTPAQAEKKVGKRFEELLEPLIEQPLGEPTLAPESDPRLPLPPEFEPC